MTLYRWYDTEIVDETESQWNNSIVADRIEFAPGHVVWRDLEHKVLLALRNNRVDDLVQFDEIEDGAEVIGVKTYDPKRECGALSPSAVGRVKVCTFNEHPPSEPHSWQWTPDA